MSPYKTSGYKKHYKKFSKQGNKTKPNQTRNTKQTLVFNCYKSWLYKEMSCTESPTHPK